MSEINLRDGDWIKVAREWALLDGSKPEARVEGRYEYYGCETGCIGYRIYVVRGDAEDVFGFEFGAADAIEKAEELSERFGLPIVMEKDRDW